MSSLLELKSLEELLKAQGLDITALTDPGARFGFGMNTQYGNLFNTFDVDAFNQGSQALLDLESSLMGQIEDRLGSGTRQIEGSLISNLEKINQMGRPSGLKGGARDRLMRSARRSSMSSFGDLLGKTESQRMSTQEQLGSQAAELQGVFSSFLGDAVSRYLQILQADPNLASQTPTTFEDDEMTGTGLMTGQGQGQVQGDIYG